MSYRRGPLSQTAENNCPYHRVVGFLIRSGQFKIIDNTEFLKLATTHGSFRRLSWFRVRPGLIYSRGSVVSPEPRVMGAVPPAASPLLVLLLLLCIPGATTRSPSCIRIVIIGGQEVLVRRDLGLGVRQVLLRFSGEFRACDGFVIDLTGAIDVELLSLTVGDDVLRSFVLHRHFGFL